MSSPNPNQQYPPPGFTDQSYSQPGPQYPDNRYLQNYPYDHQYQYPAQQNPNSDYVQPQYGSTTSAAFIAELPAPLPPAPPTSTSQRQLTEDELLAHKLQQMEVEEIRRRSSSNLRHQPSQYSVGAPPSPEVRQSPLQPPAPSRPHSQSVSSLPPYGPDSFRPPPSQPSPSLLPEVVPAQRPLSMSAGAPNPTIAVPHPTAHLPPAPSDPASLSAYLELHRQVPYPPQWILSPVEATFYGSFVYAPKADWLDTLQSQEWRTVRYTENATNPTPPSYTFSFKTKGGSFRDPRYSWTMTPAVRKDKLNKSHPGTWSYNLRMDLDSGMRKSELLSPPRCQDLITTYIHAQNYDSLRFVGPDGRLYMWVAHAPLSSINGARYDTIRHALFQAKGQSDPLYGQIVADHTYWDGHVNYNEVHTGVSCNGCGASPIHGLRWICKSCVDHNICEPCRLSNNSVKPTCSFSLVNLPDEALYIRSPNVDPSLVVATLQVLKDWERHTVRQQRMKNPSGFAISENKARKTDLGRISYWRSSDFEGKGAPADSEVHGTSVKVRECAKMAAEVGNALREIGNAIGGDSGSGGDGGGAGDGGGGGGGGGDSGGGGGGGGDGGGGGGGAC